jgi:hypothetical protein
MGVLAGIPLMHQPLDLLYKELYGLLMESLHHCGLHAYV